MEIDPKYMSHPLVPGLIGALIGLRFAPGVAWLERVTNVIAGGACAAYVAPAAGEIFKLTSVSMLGFLSFFVGMFGMSIAAAVMQGVRDLKLADIISGWLSRRG